MTRRLVLLVFVFLDCQLLYAPAIQACNNGFNDCTQACASCRQPADCPIPTLRQRSGAH
jgi:hypothetical protein